MQGFGETPFGSEDMAWWVDLILALGPGFMWLWLVPLVCVIASVVVSITPTPEDDKMWGVIYNSVIKKLFALQFGRAEEPPPNKVAQQQAMGKSSTLKSILIAPLLVVGLLATAQTAKAQGLTAATTLTPLAMAAMGLAFAGIDSVEANIRLRTLWKAQCATRLDTFAEHGVTLGQQIVDGEGCPEGDCGPESKVEPLTKAYDFVARICQGEPPLKLTDIRDDVARRDIVKAIVDNAEARLRAGDTSVLRELEGIRDRVDWPRTIGSKPAGEGEVAALRAQVQELQDFAMAAKQALAAQGVSVPGQPGPGRPAVPVTRSVTPTNALRQLPTPGGER